jgi:thiamine pyrophosphate-dependent acetolactate synthase large subunit-like protein
MADAAWTVGRYVVESLAANGIDTVLGIPGVHNIELYRGLASASVRHLLVRHEQNATFAADGFARASGRPAAAFVISGPGLTNALTALAQAYSDSVPLLLVASTPIRSSLGKGWGVLHESADQRALAAQFTGFAGSARSDLEVREQLRGAFAALRQPRARPAYLDIPLDLIAEPTTLRPESFPVPPAAPAPDPAALAAALALLRTAQRPLIIAGGGARHAAAPLLQLSAALDAYIITTVAAKGILPHEHPANLGASLPYAPTQELAASADVVLAVGTELSETDIFSMTKLPMRGRLIRIDVDESKLGDHYAAHVKVHADAAQALGQLARTVEARRGWRSSAGSAAQQRERIDAPLAAPWRQALAALRAMRAALPADALVFTDMTQIAYLGCYAFPVEHPGRWFHPSGYGTLGYALPAALGARLAEPQRAVMALAGDFGVQFTLSELMTAVEHSLNLPIVVWNNGALGQIRDDMRANGIPPTDVVARNPDFIALAAACGASAARVQDGPTLTSALREALARRGPTLIEVLAGDFRTE